MNTLTQINCPTQKFWRSDVASSQKLTEIAIVDSAIPDFESLHQGIKPGIATYSLDKQTDGVEQIAQILAKHANIQTLHIISHGSPGTLYLGATELNNSNIENYRQQLRQWCRVLAVGASIILYGCRAAATVAGKQLVDRLHQITGANIAANLQATGNSGLGGTWNIPQLVPPYPSAPELALAATALKTYKGLLLGFSTQVTFAAGEVPRDVSIGDINGDGKPDLAVANYGSNNVSILLNTTPTGGTTPTFATQVVFATGRQPRTVSIGDINGDGKPDLAVANALSNNVSILLNTTPTGGTTPPFATQVTFATGTQPRFTSI
ncbi:MAG: DUF4347 domain-containing protein, partial [Oscillatoriales cyanobacterium RU_3_3]|nr:DUF4347 domain-containing protein [Oscillatoriales cyanobacterium RU_3_3]